MLCTSGRLRTATICRFTQPASTSLATLTPHRFLYSGGGCVDQQGNYSRGAAQFLLPHVIGTYAPMIGRATDSRVSGVIKSPTHGVGNRKRSIFFRKPLPVSVMTTVRPIPPGWRPTKGWGDRGGGGGGWVFFFPTQRRRREL